MHHFEFVTLTVEQAQQAYLLHCQCHSNPWSLASFKDCLTAPYFACQLHTDNRLVGYYIGLQVLDEVTLMDIGVTADLRAHGFGWRLLEHFIHRVKTQKGKQIFLEVRASNCAAIGLYQKAGFAVVEVRKNYYQTKKGREDALVMACSLTKLP